MAFLLVCWLDPIPALYRELACIASFYCTAHLSKIKNYWLESMMASWWDNFFITSGNQKRSFDSSLQDMLEIVEHQVTLWSSLSCHMQSIRCHRSLSFDKSSSPFSRCLIRLFLITSGIQE